MVTEEILICTFIQKEKKTTYSNTNIQKSKLLLE